ncbi:MAG: Gfo/Idh/MocA family oxidoreductase, partial [Nitrososphaerota archaeon]
MKKARFAVIGLGWFGEKHVHVLSELPNVEVVAVCSRTESRAREVANKYGAKRWYTDWNKVVKDPEVEAVSVVTHVPEHKEPTILAAEAGKHVLVEKPIAGNLKDADEMIASTEKNKVHFMVGHILRFESRYA